MEEWFEFTQQGSLVAIGAIFLFMLFNIALESRNWVKYISTILYELASGIPLVKSKMIEMSESLRILPTLLVKIEKFEENSEKRCQECILPLYIEEDRKKKSELLLEIQAVKNLLLSKNGE